MSRQSQPPDVASFCREYGDVIYGFVKEFTDDESLAALIFRDSISCIIAKKREFDPSKMNYLTYIRQIVRETAIELSVNTPFTTGFSLPRFSTYFLEVAEMLSPLHKTIFYLRYYEGKNEYLISEQSQLPVTEIKQKLRETVRKLSGHL